MSQATRWIALLPEPFAGHCLECIGVPGDLVRQGRLPRVGGMDPLLHPVTSFIAGPPRVQERHVGIRTEREDVFLADDSVPISPELRAVPPHLQVETVPVGKLAGIVGSLCLPDLDVGEGHESGYQRTVPARIPAFSLAVIRRT